MRVERELAELDFARFFDAVVCHGDYARRKPHPEPLQVGLQRMGLTPEESAYIGDSPEDVRMAQAAGALAVGVPGAFPNRGLLVASAPELLAPSLDAAVDALLARLGGGRIA